MCNVAVLFLALTGLTGSLASNDTLRFFVLGDFGGIGRSPYYSAIQTSVANQIAKLAAVKGGVDFVMELGDNFYESGIKNENSHRFRDTFERVYHHNSLQVPFYIIAGNHDHRGNVSGQIAYTKLSSRWKFPYYYYPLSFKIPGSDANIDFVMLDTITLCGHSNDDDNDHQPTGPMDAEDASAQWAFVTNKLTLSKATYLWVMGHYPVYSIAGHGPTRCLTSGLLPLLKEHRANGYMCGHDHNLQHLQLTDQKHDLDFFVSGCSSRLSTRTSHRDSVPTGSSKFFWADTHGHGGFLYVEVKADQMVSTFYNSGGTVLYQKISYPRQRNHNPIIG